LSVSEKDVKVMFMDWKKIFEGRFLALTLSVLAVGQSLLAVAVFFVVVGTRDLVQTRHEILRNYSIIGHLRFFFKKIWPETRRHRNQEGPLLRGRRNDRPNSISFAYESRPLKWCDVNFRGSRQFALMAAML
jgi:hypothetical protein